MARIVVNDDYPPIPDCYSEHLKLLIEGMLKKNPEKRPSIDVIVKGHPLIKAEFPRYFSSESFLYEFDKFVQRSEDITIEESKRFPSLEGFDVDFVMSYAPQCTNVNKDQYD